MSVTRGVQESKFNFSDTFPYVSIQNRHLLCSAGCCIEITIHLQGALLDVESDLPKDILEEAIKIFLASIADKTTIKDAIKKVYTGPALFEHHLLKDRNDINLSFYFSGEQRGPLGRGKSL